MGERFVCPVCDKAFDTLQGLKTHYRMHENGNIVCPVCGKQFKSPQRVCIHAHQMAWRHNDGKHAVVCWLTHTSSNHRSNQIFKWGSKLAEKLLVEGGAGLRRGMP